jgi:predicted PurR-regulated permease PerM
MLKDKETTETIKKEFTYLQKVWNTVGIVALLVVVILITRVAFNILLMVLAGSLIAVYFHGLGDIIQRKTRMARKYAMIISIVGSFIILGLLLWFMGSKISAQIAELSNTLPHTVNAAKASMGKTPLGQKILQNFQDDDSHKLMNTVQTFFSCFWEFFLRPALHYIKMGYCC